uniref:Uncharacterized protein n=1 Tax=Octopus bimaculoides TaxID=37653 RepID=A0A0L8FSA8_OCTBM
MILLMKKSSERGNHSNAFWRDIERNKLRKSKAKTTVDGLFIVLLKQFYWILY